MRWFVQQWSKWIPLFVTVYIRRVRTVARSTQNGSLSGFLLTMHVRFCWFKLLSVYAVDAGDTDDLIFTRNIDEIVAMSRHAKDGDGGR